MAEEGGRVVVCSGTDLDEDVVIHYAGFLSLPDVCNLAMTSSALKHLAYSDSIWQHFFRRDLVGVVVARGVEDGGGDGRLEKDSARNLVEINGMVLVVYLPAPTVALRPPLALNARPIANFFHGCPDNAF
ncbi:hypothetical protein Fmac_010488 [Flemingia macrophylla]|uniref:F-box domain-containing protein n=1 Tax=Flemingia macrophylla TaxID=520843 RepID=A0ABD1MJR0_9FABA